MAAGEATGGALGIAVIGVQNLTESLGFFRGIVGMDVVAQGPWNGLSFAGHWRVPPETNATAVML
ncbi:MAG: hypothetical protein EXQ85_01575 [Alphaproteobacteria bacterium]|nr:hypothetical protein [Alphaproteobacteria bacterium]